MKTQEETHGGIYLAVFIKAVILAVILTALTVILQFQPIYTELLCFISGCSPLGHTLPPSVHHMAQLGTALTQFLDLWLWITMWQPTCGKAQVTPCLPAEASMLLRERQIHSPDTAKPQEPAHSRQI